MQGKFSRWLALLHHLEPLAAADVDVLPLPVLRLLPPCNAGSDAAVLVSCDAGSADDAAVVTDDAAVLVSCDAGSADDAAVVTDDAALLAVAAALLAVAAAVASSLWADADAADGPADADAADGPADVVAHADAADDPADVVADANAADVVPDNRSWAARELRPKASPCMARHSAMPCAMMRCLRPPVAPALSARSLPSALARFRPRIQ
eukprot:6491232-Amphidinium_carterae.2